MKCVKEIPRPFDVKIAIQGATVWTEIATSCGIEPDIIIGGLPGGCTPMDAILAVLKRLRDKGVGERSSQPLRVLPKAKPFRGRGNYTNAL